MAYAALLTSISLIYLENSSAAAAHASVLPLLSLRALLYF